MGRGQQDILGFKGGRIRKRFSIDLLVPVADDRTDVFLPDRYKVDFCLSPKKTT